MGEGHQAEEGFVEEGFVARGRACQEGLGLKDGP